MRGRRFTSQEKPKRLRKVCVRQSSYLTVERHSRSWRNLSGNPIRRSRDEHSGANRGADEGTDRSGKRQTPTEELIRQIRSEEQKKSKQSFYEALKKPGMSYICEVKKASPSKG